MFHACRFCIDNLVKDLGSTLPSPVTTLLMEFKKKRGKEIAEYIVRHVRVSLPVCTGPASEERDWNDPPASHCMAPHGNTSRIFVRVWLPSHAELESDLSMYPEEITRARGVLAVREILSAFPNLFPLGVT